MTSIIHTALVRFANLQALSIVDVRMNVARKLRSVATGSISDASILDAPLISHNYVSSPDNMSNVMDVLAVLKANNPLVASHKTMLEMDDPHSGIPFLTSVSLDTILSNHRMRSPLLGMDRDEVANQLQICWDESTPIPAQVPKADAILSTLLLLFYV